MPRLWVELYNGEGKVSVGKIVEKLAIIGVGLIGGSLGLAVKERKLAAEVIGIGRREESLQKAREKGAVDWTTTKLSHGLSGVKMVILSTPVGVMKEISEKMLPFIPADCIVSDVGSVKRSVVSELEPIFYSRGYFVGAHPMAGSEKIGVETASSRLFEGTTCILTPTPRTSSGALKSIGSLWEGVGAKISLMTVDMHDYLVAAISHLPHLLAVSLVNMMEEVGTSEPEVLSLAAGGFRDTTRIASGLPSLWKEIILSNRDNIVELMGKFFENWKQLEKILKQDDGKKLLQVLTRAKTTRDRLS